MLVIELAVPNLQGNRFDKLSDQLVAELVEALREGLNGYPTGA